MWFAAWKKGHDDLRRFESAWRKKNPIRNGCFKNNYLSFKNLSLMLGYLSEIKHTGNMDWKKKVYSTID